MFINYRKMAHGLAVFVFAVGIVSVAFYSEKDSNLEADIQQKQKEQIAAVSVTPSTKKSVNENISNEKASNEKANNEKAKNEKTSNEEISKDTQIEENKPKEDFKYIVSKGDTLYDLALKYKVTVEEIQLASKLDSDKLSLDQELVIPVSGSYKELAALKRSKDAAAAKKNQPLRQVASRNLQSNNDVKAVTSSVKKGEMISWDKVKSLFPRGATAKVIDVDTGLTFKVKRLQGTYHADCEPLTANDTAVLKKIYGGSWSWARRAVVVEVNGNYIAASINGMPHAEDSIASNNFAGHICIHFKDSSTHGSSYTKSGKPLVDPQHQAMVKKAAGQ